TAQKTRKPKTNSFTSILDQILKKYNLSTESDLFQLCAHANELGDMLPDWKACKDMKEALCRRLFKGNQIEALVPDKRGKKLTIKERARYCAKTGDVWDIYLHVLDLAETKNHTDKEIVAASSRVSQFRRELAEAGVDSERIDTYAKLPEVTRASNKIQKRQLKQRLPNPPKTSKHFSLEEGLRRIQNINTTKIPTMQDLADVIMMLSMRPAEIATLHIIHYEPDESNPSKWFKPGYSWYCTGYIKNKGEAKNNPEPRQFLSMEKNPERAKELLTWIQDAIATGKLRNPVYSINGKRSTGVFSKFLKPYDITAKRLRKIRGKHASRVHGGQNPTSQHLEFLSRIAMRHKIDRFDSGKYYAEGDTSDSDLDSDPEPEPETRAPTPKSTSENTSITEIEDIYDLYGSI
ncbi:25213_t:CDS:1, partial [Dentiscutata erythropus]